MAQALPGRGAGRPGGPLVPTAPPPPADAAGQAPAHRDPAPPTLDRPADRRRGRRVASHGQPRPETPGRFSRTGHPITGDRTGQSRTRGIGWEFVHVCIDDRSRLAFSQILPDERKHSAVAFLQAAVAYYKSLGVTVERIMTDNGSCYRSKDFAKACKTLGLRHIRTKPFTPKTNGKAERFIQTALREWAYARAYQTSEQRAQELPLWLHRYNWHRPHGSLNTMTPISQLRLSEDNLLRLHI